MFALASARLTLVWFALNLALLVGTSAGLLPAQETPSPFEAKKPQDMKRYTEDVAGTAVQIEMVPVPVGTSGYPERFAMGSPAEQKHRKADEGPIRKVQIEPFWMARLEITWDIYDEFRKEYSVLLRKRLDKTAVSAPEWADAVSIPTPIWEQETGPILQGLGQAGGYPVADITQFAAMQFTKWLSKKTGRFYRLPTEAEWEYAARCGTDTAYFFGDDAAALQEYAWFFDNSSYADLDKGYPGAGAGYRRVGLKKASPWGFHDIYGNVSEWVIDQYDPKRYEKLPEQDLSWRQAVAWPTKIFPCVARGGNWDSDPGACRSSARLASHRKWQKRDPQIPKSIWWCTDAFHVGFRVVRPLRAPTDDDRRFWEPTIGAIQHVLEKESKELRVKIEVQK